MKRSGKRNEHAKAVQKLGQNPTDSSVVAAKKTREQLEDEAWRAFQKVTGTQSQHAADRLLRQAANALVWPGLKPDGTIIKSAAVMAEMAPQNATETMLSIQMIAAHEAALLFVSRATVASQTTEAIDANVLRATRLMRVFIDQLAAMQKLKGKAGQQKVTVEHVHVHGGGQAIVGAVSASKGERT